jgi:hypothetical protein
VRRLRASSLPSASAPSRQRPGEEAEAEVVVVVVVVVVEEEEEAEGREAMIRPTFCMPFWSQSRLRSG